MRRPKSSPHVTAVAIDRAGLVMISSTRVSVSAIDDRNVEHPY
jgi:hypothetical protein